MKILSFFYLCLVFFYGLPILIFSTQLVIFGQGVTIFLAQLLHVFFIVLFYLLYLLIRRAKKSGLRIALTLHSVFLLNNLLMIVGRTPIFETKGLTPATADIAEELSVIFSICINILVIVYLFREKRYFVDNR